MAAGTVTLDFFQQSVPIVDKNGKPTPYFIRQMQLRQQAIEGAVPSTREINTAAGQLTGGGDLSVDLTLGLADTAVAPGSYTSTDLTVDEFGRITAASNGGGGPGAGIWWFQPPLVADLAVVQGGQAASVTLVDDSAGMLATIAAPGTDSPFGFMDTIPTPSGNWFAEIGFIPTARAGNFSGIGMAMGNSAASKLGVLRYEFNGAINGPFMGSFTLPTGFISNPGNGTNLMWQPPGPLFCRIEHIAASSRLHYSVGLDARSWYDFYDDADTAMLGAIPEYVGFGGFVTRATPNNKCDVVYWNKSW